MARDMSLVAAGTSLDAERFLDESLEETFPASDPIAPVQPGSSAALRAAGRAAGGEDGR